MKTKFVVSFLLLFALSAFGQLGQVATSNSSIVVGGSDSGISLSNNSSALTPISSSSNSGFWCDPTGAWYFSDSRGVTRLISGGNPNAETRKPKLPLTTIAMVKASAHKLPRLAPPAYLSLAKSIHLQSAATDEAEMLDIIDELALPVYDFAKVDQYLMIQAKKQGTNVRWVWKPMRNDDMHLAGDSGFTHNEKAGWLSYNQYQNVIPADMLERVALVLGKKEDAVFLVSDYEVVKPDPFLAVTTKDLLKAGKIWVIGQWDEPGFLGKPDVHSIIKYTTLLTTGF